MASPQAMDTDTFEAEANRLLEAIARARERVEDLPGVLDGTLDRFRARIDRLLRESEVDSRRQIRIFLRDVDDLAEDLAKASKEKRLAPKHILVLDASLRKARKRDFYGARKAWRKLDRFADHAAEVQSLQADYREHIRAAKARLRQLRNEIGRLERVPKPTVSPAEAAALVSEVDAFNEAAETMYLDFLARAPAHIALPILLDACQGGGIGVPAPPQGTDPEPLLELLSDADPARDALRTRSFYGLLELPNYSDAKLTHVMGDSRLVRRALEEAWPWLKALREDERRSLRVQWTDDVGVLKQRLPAVAAFLSRLGPENEAASRAEDLTSLLSSGRFEEVQRASRLYGTYGEEAKRKWSGELDRDIESMEEEATQIGASLRKFPDPDRVESGEIV